MSRPSQDDSTARPSAGEMEAKFTRLYSEHGRAVLAYAMARAPSPEDAADVLAETFLVAWRQAAELPPGPDARFWLYAVARGALANQRRGERRRGLLAARLRSELAVAAHTLPEPDSQALAIREAIARMADEDREVLLLSAHAGLRSREIGQVLGITPNAARIRLHRARRRLRNELCLPKDLNRPISQSAGLKFEEA